MINSDEIKKFETLVKIELTEAERELFSRRLSEFFNSLGAFAGVRTDGVEPLVTALGVKNIFREDIPVKNHTRDELLAAAPETYGGCYRAPRTVE